MKQREEIIERVAAMKKYSCPNASCEQVSTADEWNMATRKKFNKPVWDDIEPIDGEKGNYLYICPKCGHEDTGNYINYEGED
jgi:hypothetical protein